MQPDKVIYKYEIPIKEYPYVNMPMGARVLSFQSQNNKLYAWAEVDKSADNSLIKFALVPTGGEVPISGSYIGTAMIYSGGLVFHLYYLEDNLCSQSK